MFSLSFVSLPLHAELRVFYCRVAMATIGPYWILRLVAAAPGNGATSSLGANNFLSFAVWMHAKAKGHPIRVQSLSVVP